MNIINQRKNQKQGRSRQRLRISGHIRYLFITHISHETVYIFGKHSTRCSIISPTESNIISTLYT